MDRTAFDRHLANAEDAHHADSTFTRDNGCTEDAAIARVRHLRRRDAASTCPHVAAARTKLANAQTAFHDARQAGSCLKAPAAAMRAAGKAYDSAVAAARRAPLAA